MNAVGASRMTAFCITLLSLAAPALLWSGYPVRASSITLKWADPFDGRPVFIEVGASRLFDGKLEGSDLVIDTDTMLADGSSNISAILNVEGIDDLAVAINLFKCTASCDWRITFTAFEVGNSLSVNSICQTNPRSFDGHLKKYFFCRKTHADFVDAGGVCWNQTRYALTGWFDAAYKLHELTLRGGIGFIARDTEVEALVEDSLKKCDDFEASVGRNDGYFRGMIQNLNVAILQQTQRVERSLAAENPAEARDLAEKIVQQLDAVTVRNAISARDAKYVEGIVNRSLAPGTNFTLR